MGFNVLDQAALLLAVTAAFAYFNHHVLRLPRNVGLLALALAASVVLRLLAIEFPELTLNRLLGVALARIDFAPLMLNLLLGFLLFAGAIEVDLKALLERKWTILALATAGVFVSTVLVGLSMWAIFAAVGIAVPIFYCLAFGALISPTDPVTVLEVLRRTPVPDRLRTIISGEALFNDGIGIVLYALLLEAALEGGAMPGPLVWAIEFLREAGGGALLGLGTGLLAFVALRGIDEYSIELMISLALVAGTYGIANTIGVSGPVAVVTAGLMMGSIGRRYAISDRTHDYLSKFWALVDELLNALLYFLVGLEFATVALDWRLAGAAAAAIALSLAARALSIATLGVSRNLRAEHKLRGIAVMSWSGLRGGISLALALSIPAQDFRDPLIAITYAVVIFTMLVQGLSLDWLCRRLYPPTGPADDKGEKA